MCLIINKSTYNVTIPVKTLYLFCPFIVYSISLTSTYFSFLFFYFNLFLHVFLAYFFNIFCFVFLFFLTHFILICYCFTYLFCQSTYSFLSLCNCFALVNFFLIWCTFRTVTVIFFRNCFLQLLVFFSLTSHLSQKRLQLSTLLHVQKCLDVTYAFHIVVTVENRVSCPVFFPWSLSLKPKTLRPSHPLLLLVS